VGVLRSAYGLGDEPEAVGGERLPALGAYERAMIEHGFAAVRVAEGHAPAARRELAESDAYQDLPAYGRPHPAAQATHSSGLIQAPRRGRK
jgi:hypothetical protein